MECEHLLDLPLVNDGPDALPTAGICRGADRGANRPFPSANAELLSPSSRRAWRVAQVAVWFIGIAVLGLLLFQPRAGLAALWNVIIPVAPALLVFAPGLWRNICPLGVTALAARHVGLSARHELPHRARVGLNLVGVVALLLIVLLRRLSLNNNALASAAVLGGLAVLSVVMGMIFEWKSGWCSGLCPVHGVEKLYGSKALVSFPNAHCDACQRCTAPCPDSTDAMHPMIGPRWSTQRLTENLLVGGFPGYVWGWFHVPDSVVEAVNWQNYLRACQLPFGGLLVTCALFVIVRRFVPKRGELQLVRVFAAAAVACYYWYRIPALFGYGLFPDDGVLLNLTGALPDWWVALPRTLTTGLLVWWLVIHQSPVRHWADRPPLAKATSLGGEVPVD